MAKRELTEEEIDRVINLHGLGYPIKRIARDIGVDRAKIYFLLRLKGLETQYPNKSKQKLNDSQKQEVLSLYQSGVRTQDIAKQMGVGSTLIYTVFQELGIKLGDGESGQTHALTDRQKWEVALLYERGVMNTTELAHRYNVSLHPIYDALREHRVIRKGYCGPKQHNARHVFPSGRFCKFKSRWEWLFAIHLEERNLHWTYESHVWELPDGTSYIPDFWVAEWDVFIEIKGYMTKDAEIKISFFRETYPHLKLLVLDRKALELYGIDLSKKAA